MKDFIPPFFKDFGKTVSDVFKPSKYDLNKSIEVATKAGSGVNFTAKGTVAESATTGGLNIKGDVCGHAEMSADVGTSGAVSTTFTNTSLLKGLKLTGTVSTTPKSGAFLVTEEASYKCNHMAVTGSVTSDCTLKDIRANGSVAFGAEGVAVGGDMLYKGNEIADYNAGAEYAEQDFTVTVKTAKKAEQVMAAYSHKINGDATAVAAFTFDFSKATPGKTLAIGGIYSLDSSSKVFTMLSTQGSGAACWTTYETTLNPSAKLSVSSMMDLSHTAISNHKVGMKLEFSS